MRVQVELVRLREYAVSHAADEAANLRVALAGNRRIGTALGILMYRFKIGNDESFTLLRETIQRLNRKLGDRRGRALRRTAYVSSSARSPAMRRSAP
jgi:AmiR/NasT family two-component response regulator